jgi:hypothetical protein
MRKRFEVRARLVLYMEQEDLNRLTAQAREAGRTVVDYARDVLLAPAVVPGIRVSQEMRRDDAHELPRKRSGLDAAVGLSTMEQVQEEARAKPGQPQCAHGVKRGFRCWLCKGSGEHGNLSL